MIKRKLNPECGQRLKQCLNDIGMTQKELALVSQYTPQYISNIIVGKKQLSVEAANIISKILHIRVEYLLCEDEYKTEKEMWSKRHDLFDQKENIAFKLLHLAGYEPICDFVRNWKEHNLDKIIFGPFQKGDTAGQHIPDYLDGKLDYSTEILTPNGKKFYCDSEDFELLSYELIEYIHFRMAQLESKYAWRYDEAKISKKCEGSESRFYKTVNAKENPDFLTNSIWVTHDDDFFPLIDGFQPPETDSEDNK